jgi:hypothetical protein
MEIETRLDGAVIAASQLNISVDPRDLERARVLVDQTSKEVQAVNSEQTFAAAREAAGRLKSMLDEIKLSHKRVKGPFTKVGKEIDSLAKDVSEPIKAEQDRILGLLGTYVNQLELARKQKELMDAQERRVRWEESIRNMRDAKTKEEREQAQLAFDLAADVEALGNDELSPRGLVPGGRVNHIPDFELLDVGAVFEGGYAGLLRCELDILACRDAVKRQLEANPDLEPSLPGIRIIKRTNVSVHAPNRIT